MKNVLAVCPNPSVDVSLSVGKLKIGELNRVSPPIVTFSGKAINALKAAAILGAPGTATGFMPENDGDDFRESLLACGCQSAFVTVAGGARRNVKICEADGRLTELNAPGAAVGEEDKRMLTDTVKKLSADIPVAVISGSLPEGCGAGFYGELSKACVSRYKIIDAEGDRLFSALSSGAALVKPNKAEAEQIAGFPISDGNGVLKAACALINAGAPAVLLSMGAEGAYITDGNVLFFAGAPKVEVRSAVGAGDSMVGAAAAVLAGYEGELDRDALYAILRSAVAAGTASVSTPGTNLFEKAEYDRIIGEIKPVRIK